MKHTIFPQQCACVRGQHEEKPKCAELVSWRSSVDPGAEWAKPGLDSGNPPPDQTTLYP